MGKSRGDRRVIFSSSGAAQTTSAPHLRRLLTGTATRARAEAEAGTPREPGAGATGGAVAGAERHHADAMGGLGATELKVRWSLSIRLGFFLGLRRSRVGMEFASRVESCCVRPVQ
jgi:hypothetical protein